MQYLIVIEPGGDTPTYGVVVPDIEGCYSAGSTFEEAITNAKAAIEGHLEILCEDGLGIPQVEDAQAHISSPEYAGWVWALVEVDTPWFLGDSQKVNVTLPEVLIKRIDGAVARQPIYKSRSNFLAQAATRELSQTAGGG